MKKFDNLDKEERKVKASEPQKQESHTSIPIIPIAVIGVAIIFLIVLCLLGVNIFIGYLRTNWYDI